MAQYTREMFYKEFGIYPEQYGVIIGERWAKYNGYTNDQDPKTLDVYKYINEQVDKLEGLPYYLPFKPEGNWYTEYNDFARLMQNWSRYSDYEIRRLFEETKEKIRRQEEEKRRQEEEKRRQEEEKRRQEEELEALEEDNDYEDEEIEEEDLEDEDDNDYEDEEIEDEDDDYEDEEDIEDEEEDDDYEDEEDIEDEDDDYEYNEKIKLNIIQNKINIKKLRKDINKLPVYSYLNDIKDENKITLFKEKINKLQEEYIELENERLNLDLLNNNKYINSVYKNLLQKYKDLYNKLEILLNEIKKEEMSEVVESILSLSNELNIEIFPSNDRNNLEIIPYLNKKIMEYDENNYDYSITELNYLKLDLDNLKVIRDIIYEIIEEGKKLNIDYKDNNIVMKRKFYSLTKLFDSINYVQYIRIGQKEYIEKNKDSKDANDLAIEYLNSLITKLTLYLDTLKNNNILVTESNCVNTVDSKLDQFLSTLTKEELEELRSKLNNKVKLK